jgi:bis(5'-nucleosidyl)-tetraphosphatase
MTGNDLKRIPQPGSFRKGLNFNRLHLPGLTDLLAPCTQHLTDQQFKRMLNAWQSLPQYHVYGFVQYGHVIGMIALEGQTMSEARVLSVAVKPRLQGRGIGKRLVVETFLTLNLMTLDARTLEELLGFYQKLGFEVIDSCARDDGQLVYRCRLTQQALYAAYTHEHSAGAVLFSQSGTQRLYVLVTERSGNTGLPKGHVETGETQEQTALREIYEETGLPARLLPGFGGEIVYPQGRGMLKHFTYFLAEYDAQLTPVSGEDVIAQALPYEQALQKLSFADVRKILRNAETFLNQLRL